MLTAAHCAKVGKRRRLSVFAGSASIAPNRRLSRIKVTGVAIDPTYNGRKVAARLRRADAGESS